MAVYNVYLANLGGSQIDKASIATTLQGYFDAIIKKKPKGYDSAKVQWATDAPTMSTAELLVYFVQNSMDSILASMSGFPSDKKGKDGTTFWNSTHTGSEVYCAGKLSEPKLLANLAMHEMMHNKSHIGDTLHSKSDMAADTVTAATSFSDANATFMASKLPDAHTQWTDGFVRYNDPLRGI